MGTVRDSLPRIAAQFGVDPDEYARFYLDRVIAPTAPERYRRLVADVLWRLPEDWDAARTWGVEFSDDPGPRGYASARREEEGEGEIEQLWFVTLYPALLDRLSDAACRWVIAHELGHVASGLPHGSVLIEGKPYTKVKGTTDEYEEAPATEDQEDVASKIAMEWGFTGELTVWLKEDEDQST